VVSVIAGGWEDFAIGVGKGVGLIGIEGGTRGVRRTGATEAAGVVIGLTEAEAAVWGAAVADGLDLIVGRGWIRGDGDAAGVGLGNVVAAGRGVGLVTGFGVAAAVERGVGLVTGFGVAVAVAFGVAAGVAVAAAFASGVALGVTAGVALAAAGAVVVGAGAVVVAAVGAGVADAVVVDASTGLTNFFGGAFGGGVASAFILVRARSAAERSAIAVQPVSMFNSMTRSLTRRGRGRSRTSVMTGAEISSSSPRTVAIISVFCRRRR
jgi:hypothetical protein